MSSSATAMRWPKVSLPARTSCISAIAIRRCDMPGTCKHNILRNPAFKAACGACSRDGFSIEFVAGTTVRRRTSITSLPARHILGRRIKKAYHRNSTVIYPNVAVDDFVIDRPRGGFLYDLIPDGAVQKDAPHRRGLLENAGSATHRHRHGAAISALQGAGRPQCQVARISTAFGLAFAYAKGTRLYFRRGGRFRDYACRGTSVRHTGTGVQPGRGRGNRGRPGHRPAVP